MPSIGVPELLIIFFIILVIFGAGRLPEIGAALGKGIREFRGSVRDEGTSKEEKNDTAGKASS